MPHIMGPHALAMRMPHGHRLHRPLGPAPWGNGISIRNQQSCIYRVLVVARHVSGQCWGLGVLRGDGARYEYNCFIFWRAVENTPSNSGLWTVECPPRPHPT